MSALDICITLLILVISVFGMFRGFGRSIFDALCLYGALWASDAIADPSSDLIHLNADKSINHAVLFAVSFVLVGVAALVISRFLSGAAMIHAGSFDALLGLAAGIAVGVIVAHATVKTISTADPVGNGAAVLAATDPVSSEVLNFDGYHATIDTIASAGSHRREIPDVSSK